MKAMIVFALLLTTSTFAIMSNELQLKADLATLILDKEDITTSDGEITNMQCGSYYDGIFCEVEFTFYDEMDVYVCTEGYSYRGGEEYWIHDSDCWFRR